MSGARFHRLKSTLAPLPIDNVDTDQIIPASYLKVTSKEGLGQGLFAGWRYTNPERREGQREDFVLNRGEYSGARILVAGDNFGCGSSREHAPWSLLDYGFRAVLSTRFADIFRNNALKNGLLVVAIPAALQSELLQRAAAEPDTEISIDLERQQIELWDARMESFEVDPFARHCLLQGVDQLGYLMDQLPQIEAYERSRSVSIDTLS